MQKRIILLCEKLMKLSIHFTYKKNLIALMALQEKLFREVKLHSIDNS